jgi:hypothetical protein
MVRQTSNSSVAHIWPLLLSISEQTHCFPDGHSITSLGALEASLRPTEGIELSDKTFEFLDNAIIRFGHRNSKYYDLYTTLAKDLVQRSDRDSVPAHPSCSLLLLALFEQWPFLLKSEVLNNSDKRRIASWLSRYIGFLAMANENSILLSHICDQLAELGGSKRIKRVFADTSERLQRITGSDSQGRFKLDLVHDSTVDETSRFVVSSVSGLITIGWGLNWSSVNRLIVSVKEGLKVTPFDFEICTQALANIFKLDSEANCSTHSLEDTFTLMRTMISEMRASEHYQKISLGQIRHDLSHEDGNLRRLVSDIKDLGQLSIKDQVYIYCKFFR